MKNTFAVLFYTLVSFVTFAQKETDFKGLIQYVDTLSSEELEGRRAGTKGEEKSAIYLSSQLKQLGIRPYQHSYFDEFEFDDISHTKRSEKHYPNIKKAKNVIGFIDNKRDRTIVLGAHYDHLGKGYHVNSRSTSKNPIHYGADDNASGVACVLTIGDQLANNDIQESYNFIIVFFSAEEIGLLGSKSWVSSIADSMSIAGMINLDMVGRMKDDKIQIFGIGTSPSWSNVIPVRTSEFNWEIDSSGIGPSDHASFYLDSIPAIHLFTGQHEDYHRETDTPEKLNYSGMLRITDLIYSSLLNVNDKEKFEFTPTKINSTRKRPELKVTLGIMPSYSSSNDGLKIDGVIAGKPASKAKLKKGDIITHIYDFRIKDIYDYMEALSKFEEGDSTTVTVNRNNKTKTLSINF